MDETLLPLIDAHYAKGDDLEKIEKGLIAKGIDPEKVKKTIHRTDAYKIYIAHQVIYLQGILNMLLGMLSITGVIFNTTFGIILLISSPVFITLGFNTSKRNFAALVIAVLCMGLIELLYLFAWNPLAISIQLFFLAGAAYAIKPLQKIRESLDKITK